MTEYFPELNIHFLKLIGKRWAKRYDRVPIELILLAKHNDIRFSKDYLEDEFIRREGFEPVQIKEAKYDIFFVISYDKDLFDEAKIGYTGKDVSEYHLQLIRGEKKPGALQDFLNNIEYGQNKSQAKYVRLLTDGFHDDAYKEPPNSILWRQDWDIHVVLQNYKNTNNSIYKRMEDEPCVVLYNAIVRSPEEFERDENMEQAIWNKYVKPIVTQHNMDFSYHYFPNPDYIKKFDVYLMERKLLEECNIFYGCNNFIGKVLTPLKYNEVKINSKAGEINLVLFFDRFLNKLFKQNFYKGLGLPHFLHWLQDQNSNNDDKITYTNGRHNISIHNRQKQEAEAGSIDVIYDEMKNLDCWSLNEGIGLLTKPVLYLDQFNGPSFDEFANDVLCKIDLRVLYRSIDAGNLNVIGYDKEKIKNWDFEKSSPVQYSNDQNYHNCQAEYWRDCYGNLKVNPFEFLEFVKEKQLFEIPSELEFVKKTFESGEIQYSWASDINEDADPVSNVNTIGQNKTSIIETDDRKNKVIPGQGKVKKIEQDIKNIKISSVNKSQIAFQEPGKKKIFVTYDSLGLMGVHLSAFKEVLENFPHSFKIGSSKDEKEYGSRQKQLKFISDRLLKNLFKEKLKFSIPSGYKLYELDKTKESGTYKFKFDIVYKDTEDHDESSKETFEKELDIAYQKYSDQSGMQTYFDNVVNLVKTGMVKGFLTGEEAKKYFEKDRFKEQFSEFEKEDVQPTIDPNEDKK